MGNLFECTGGKPEIIIKTQTFSVIVPYSWSAGGISLELSGFDNISGIISITGFDDDTDIQSFTLNEKTLHILCAHNAKNTKANLIVTYCGYDK